jgi:antitoxin component YwqK of YwqJK toxin-antitoxin module
MHLITSRLLFIAVLSSFSISSFSQSDTLFYFFDKNGKPCQSKKAAYVGFGFKENGLIQYTNYSVKDELPIIEGNYVDSTLTIKNGYFKRYNPPGYLAEEGNYLNNQKEGYWLKWDTNSQNPDSDFYKHGDLLLTIRTFYGPQGFPKSRALDNMIQDKREFNYWYDDGKPKISSVLIKGDGEELFYDEDGTVTGTEKFKNGRIISSVHHNKDGTLMSDQEVQEEKSKEIADRLKMPEYTNEGIPGFLYYFQNHLLLSREQYLNFHQSFLLISFNLNEEGHPCDIEVVNTNDQGVQESVKQLLNSMPGWDMKGYKKYGTFRLNISLKKKLNLR